MQTPGALARSLSGSRVRAAAPLGEAAEETAVGACGPRVRAASTSTSHQHRAITTEKLQEEEQNHNEHAHTVRAAR